MIIYYYHTWSSYAVIYDDHIWWSYDDKNRVRDGTRMGLGWNRTWDRDGTRAWDRDMGLGWDWDMGDISALSNHARPSVSARLVPYLMAMTLLHEFNWQLHIASGLPRFLMIEHIQCASHSSSKRCCYPSSIRMSKCRSCHVHDVNYVYQDLNNKTIMSILLKTSSSVVICDEARHCLFEGFYDWRQLWLCMPPMPHPMMKRFKHSFHW